MRLAGPVVPLVAPDMMRRTSACEVSSSPGALALSCSAVVKGREDSSSRLSSLSGRPR